MLLDCHAHTRPLSRCSRLDPDTLCRLARERGLDALVVTEHHHVWPRADLDRLQARHAPLRLYGGVELSTDCGHDVVAVGPPDLLLTLGPAEPFQPWETLATRLRAARPQVFAFCAHPYRYQCETPPSLERILRDVDGIEVLSVNILKDDWMLAESGARFLPWNHACYEAARARFGLIPLVNTDSHRPEDVGCLGMSFPGPPPADDAGLAALLRETPGRERQNAALLSARLRTGGLAARLDEGCP